MSEVCIFIQLTAYVGSVTVFCKFLVCSNSQIEKIAMYLNVGVIKRENYSLLPTAQITIRVSSPCNSVLSGYS